MALYNITSTKDVKLNFYPSMWSLFSDQVCYAIHVHACTVNLDRGNMSILKLG